MAPDLRTLNRASAEYLQAIYELEEEGSEAVQAKIARRLGLSPPTVWEGIRRLLTDELVMASGRALFLTDDGRQVAEVIVRRHRLAERMLVDLLGLPWHLCHEQADDWEMVITDEVERALLEKLEGEPVCPHGNPIPGVPSSISWEDLVPMAHLDVGVEGTLVRLLEDVELDSAVLSHLEDKGLVPGCEVTVMSIGPDGTRTVQTDTALAALGSDLAERLWVHPVGLPTKAATA